MKIQSRIDNPVEIDTAQIEKELAVGKHVIVQFSDKTYSDKKLSVLNELCKKHDKDFGIRFYGHYSGSFDFTTLLRVPDVKCLYVDCLFQADNVDTLGHLHQLEKLALGVFELKEPEILGIKSIQSVSDLILTETRSKGLNLDHLRNFKNLKLLIVGEHKKNIEAIGDLKDLEFLSLNSIKKTSIEFINRLKNLKTLKFILGGRENINEIEENAIENLEIVWVRGFNDLSNISNFAKLKTLHIEDSIQLSEIRFPNPLPDLRELKVLNCKGLKSLTGIENLPKLEQLRIYKTGIDFDSFIDQRRPDHLKTLAFYTAKNKVDAKIQTTLGKLGYRESGTVIT